MNKNRGFTYIELLVVVAIIGIAISLLSFSISTIFSMNAKKCAKDITSLISTCKVDAMSRAGSAYLLLYKTEDGVIAKYCVGGTEGPEENLGKSSLSFSCKYSNDTVDSSITEASPIYISFDRATGGFLDITSSAALAGGTVALSQGVYYKEINIASGGKNYRIRLIPSTGKYALEAS